MTANYNNNYIALLFLDQIDGLGIKRKNKLLALVSQPSELIDDIDKLKYEFVKIVGEEIYIGFLNLINSGAEKDVIEKLERNSITAIAYFDDNYPEGLINIYDRPLILYAKGNLNLLKSRCISVVGTRSPTRYGINVTRDFVAAFAQAGLTIVSGFARGIDTAAHKTAVELELPTIAVVASGLDIVYPAENLYLSKLIIDNNGLFLSEYKLGTRVTTYNFPERNRIISGLSEGVFVPEMTEKSGTMITVNHALEQGKTVYVVPANINSPASKGSNQLIKTMQGCIVTEPQDVLKDLNIDTALPEKEMYQMTLVEQQIISELEKGEAHFETLIKCTGLTVNELNSILLELEISDLIEKITGNFYILK
ncbi:MAG: DNA-processing protein DprA [Clostridia bacterium]